MGADIHVYLEKKTAINKESKWVNIDYWQLNPYYDGIDKYEREYEHVPVYTGRDYELFNILAGVRGSGDGMIEEPRGIPEDISSPTKKEYERWSGDGHSHSHFTLFELKEFLEDNPITTYGGMVKPEDAEKIDKGEGTPNMWAGWVDEELGWVYREWNEPSPLNRFVNKMNERFKEEFYIYHDNREVEKEKSFRVIFWFDN
jgi:hypothetical protein